MLKKKEEKTWSEKERYDLQKIADQYKPAEVLLDFDPTRRSVSITVDVFGQHRRSTDLNLDREIELWSAQTPPDTDRAIAQFYYSFEEEIKALLRECIRNAAGIDFLK